MGGKLFAVILVLAVIFIGIIVFLISIDLKIRKLRK